MAESHSQVLPCFQDNPIWVWAIVSLFLLMGCTENASPVVESNPANPTELSPIPVTASITPAQQSMPVTITGWFTTIWNGEPHYSITDEQGLTTILLLDDELAKPLGGPLALDRKRVIVLGEIVNEPKGAMRVLSIRFEELQK